MQVHPRDRVYVVPLGGLGEIGKNMMVIRHQDDAIIIDAGLAFPEEEMLGIDIVIPDISYITEENLTVQGIVLTHCHEDHVGALPYLLQRVRAPVYGTKLTLGLVEGKLAEFGIGDEAGLVEVATRQPTKIGPFSVEFFRVNHSTADCVGLAIRTPVGLIVHTGDFKFDHTPVDGRVSDFQRLADIGGSGVLLLMSDSTNADRPGFTPSEKVVGETFDAIFSEHKGRILVTSFASNVPRIQQVINAAVRYQRKVSVVGRSMEYVVDVATDLGYLEAPPDTIVSMEDLKHLDENRAVILTTGSQGEPMSALTRIAVGDHRRVEIRKGDLVIIAASPVPGNEKMVSRTIDNLFRRGAKVIYEPESLVHVSGHASREELKLMVNLVRPRFFLPVHGEYRHMVHHADLALDLGIPPENVVIGENGIILELTRDSCRVTGRAPSGNVLVDGLGVGDVGTVVLRDRKLLAQDGIVVAVIAIDKDEGFLSSGPDIISRGFIYVKESEPLIEEAKSELRALLEASFEKGPPDWGVIKSDTKDLLGRYFFEKTGRRPMILPVIVEA